MEENETVTREEVQKELIKAVWKDESLRAEVNANPKAAIEKITGVSIPEGMNVKVIDAAEGCVYFILPKHPRMEFGRELSSEELDKIAGGSFLVDENVPAKLTQEVFTNPDSILNRPVDQTVSMAKDLAKNLGWTK